MLSRKAALFDKDHVAASGSSGELRCGSAAVGTFSAEALAVKAKTMPNTANRLRKRSRELTLTLLSS
jgi:hypothetical protein